MNNYIKKRSKNIIKVLNKGNKGNNNKGKSYACSLQ